MPHPLVDQLRFARAEFQRGLQGLSEMDARKRLLPMNCISWNIGHLAWQEQRYFLFLAEGRILYPDIHARFANRAPACTPSLVEMQDAWNTITRATDIWLASITPKTLLKKAGSGSDQTPYTFGSLLLRIIYHYWYHNGENQSIRQLLEHDNLGEFVGDLDSEAPYRTK